MSQLSTPRLTTVATLVVAAAGILIIFVSAPDRFPPIPPGPIILSVAAGVVAFGRGRWASVVGMIVPLVILFGGIVSGELAETLPAAGNPGATAGSVIFVLGASGAIATAAISLRVGGGRPARPQARRGSEPLR